ncbi:hypothetical protein R1flu_014351 [Riccia fluitans]|uniref:RNA helicase n=1 Tax=Riccia fluitans TaxID=41844 RepID=A0ABD1YGJ5_9MARC
MLPAKHGFLMVYQVGVQTCALRNCARIVRLFLGIVPSGRVIIEPIARPRNSSKLRGIVAEGGSVSCYWFANIAISWRTRRKENGHAFKKSCTTNGRELPVRLQKSRIVEKVQENRVTIILADTGSGKSSQVPQMLLEEGMEPILCTQPRRLAVATVAKRVADERGCTLGEEVGYQIGQLNVSSTRSKIVFKTAGVLLEELRTNGVTALNRYKVLILDEVHERSVESDLLLTCVKQLLRSTSVKLLLMSATADFLKYEAYFKDNDRGERVEKIAIQNLAGKLQSLILNTKVMYLEQVVKVLGDAPKHVSLLDTMASAEEPNPADNGIDIGEGTLKMIRDLIVHLHKNEPDYSKSVLVFLPTYRSLEQQWDLLKGSKLKGRKAPFIIFVLHSSVDIESSLRAMETYPLENRKVILATNVAESSVTIPGVSFVIDSCRSLEIFWDCDVQKHQPRLRWVSESQANQRKGRTGRTCDGVVYRMVPRNVFLKFDKFETPAMQLVSLRKQALLILTAVSKAINEPISLFKKCMNPPPGDTVVDALEALVKMQAVEFDSLKGKYQPTLYGKLLISLPLSLESSMMVIRGGQLGYTWESAVLASVLDTTPNPILKPFGDHVKYANNLNSYFIPPSGEVAASHPAIMLANLYAYEFWQRTFQDKRRVERLARCGGNLVEADVCTKVQDDDLEQEWCTQHHLNLSSLRSVAETVDAIMEALHRFRPDFLNNLFGPPAYMKSSGYHHQCYMNVPDSGNGSALDKSGNSAALDNWDDWGYLEREYPNTNVVEEINQDETDSGPDSDVSSASQEEKHCLQAPFTSSGDFHSPQVEQILTALVVEVQRGYEQAPVSQLHGSGAANSDQVPVCIFFLRGNCLKGDSCDYSHSRAARPTSCRFFLSSKGCRYGASCLYYHDDPNKFELPPNSEPVCFDELEPTPSFMLELLPALDGDGQYLLLFGEGDFSFTESLCLYRPSSRIIATSFDSERILSLVPLLRQRIQKLHSKEVQIHWNVDVRRLATSSRTGDSAYLANLLPWTGVSCIIWNFPFGDAEEDTVAHHQLMMQFFASLNVLMNNSELRMHTSMPVIITLCNDQFCRWRVEKAARASFFFLSKSSPFDAKTFGGYRPVRNNLLSNFPVERPMIYMFNFLSPTVST